MNHRRTRTPDSYRICRRNGEFLRDTSTLPFTWTAREMTALSFRSRAEAEKFMWRKFVGPNAARELGVKVVG